MNTSNRSFFPFASLLLAAIVCLTGGRAQAQRTAAPSNSFYAVTPHLDKGGSFYLYLDTAIWLENLSGKLSGWREMLNAVPEMDESDKAEINKGFALLSRLIQSTGVEEISGVGVSSVRGQDQLYRTKMMFHHYPDRGQGLLWSMFGKSPHPQETLDYLPAGTVLASGFDMDLSQLWNLIEGEIRRSELPPLTSGLERFSTNFEATVGVPLQELLASLSGEFLFLLDLSETRRISLADLTGTDLEIPEPGIGLMLRTKDTRLFETIEKLLPPGDQLVRVDKPGLKMRTLPLPLPLPMAVRPTIAQAGDFIIITTHERLVEEMLAVKKGEQPGLRASAEFLALSRDIGLEGNSFNFQSRRFGRTLSQVLQSSIAKASGGAPVELLESFFNAEQVAFGVSSNTPEGWVTTAVGSQHPASVIAAPLLIAPTAVAAGLLLPALAKAKARAQTINCVNNMKQIGLAARIYSNDHNELFPKDFLTMREELVSPKILFCPNDPGKPSPVPTLWTDLDPDTISYEFVAPGGREDDPNLVICRCPIHENIGYADGRVEQKGK